MNHFLKVNPHRYVNVNGIATVEADCTAYGEFVLTITYSDGYELRLQGKPAERFDNYLASIAQNLVKDSTGE